MLTYKSVRLLYYNLISIRHICHAPLAMGTFRSPLARLS